MKTNKQKDFEKKQADFLKKLHQKGFKNARILSANEYVDPRGYRREDKELLIVK